MAEINILTSLSYYQLIVNSFFNVDVNVTLLIDRSTSPVPLSTWYKVTVTTATATRFTKAKDTAFPRQRANEDHRAATAFIVKGLTSAAEISPPFS